MPKIIITSKNPTKVESARLAFVAMFPDEQFEIESVSVSSGVSDQPCTNAETLQGALNRIDNAAKIVDADYWVGIEGGTERVGDELEGFTWVAVRSRAGIVGRARSASFFLPPKLQTLIEAGHEVGAASDILFGCSNSKHEGGTVGILTNGLLDRTRLCVDTTYLALMPFRFPELYKLEKPHAVIF